MYWIGINADIEDYTKHCQECIKRSQVAKESLQPHDIPEGPWRKIGMDYFFSIEGHPDEIVSDNGPPFQSKEFAKFLSGLGVKHTT